MNAATLAHHCTAPSQDLHATVVREFDDVLDVDPSMQETYLCATEDETSCHVCLVVRPMTWIATSTH